ncbi:hypothetical protein [Paenibacillus sp. GXUN7292]|uniref:hypothetical protein n=1 Tax=Paenibacillus sp. GXUN7292 TaxID=3422499 RepID=UPI003D7C8182
MQILLELEGSVADDKPNLKGKRRSRQISRSDFSNIMLSLGGAEEYGPWIETNKADADCLALADRHYSRQSVGAKQFCRPGNNLVLRTELGDAVWVSWYSKKRDDLFVDAIECTIFRNESAYLASDLIKWAIYATVQQWGIPKEGFITFVKESAVQSSNPGSSFLNAGFRKVGYTKVRRLAILQLLPNDVKGILREVVLAKQMSALKELITSCIENGEFSEAIEFYNDARALETQLRSMRSERVRRNKRKRDCFEPNDDPFDFLSSMSSDGWFPAEMLELLEDVY